MQNKISRRVYSYDATITPLTPIHIGSGNELAPYNYVIKDNTFYRISFEKLINKIPAVQKKELIKLMEGNNFFKIRTYIRDIYKKQYGYIYSCGIEMETILKYENKLKGADRSNENNKLSIFEFIGNYKGKYIPGSTIKGAIRGAYLGANMISEDYYNLERFPKGTYKFIVNDKDVKLEKIEKRILGLRKKLPFVDPFKNLLVSDTEILNDMIEVREAIRTSKKRGMPLGSHEVTKSILSSEETIKLKFSITIKECDIDEEIINRVLEQHKKGNNVVEEVKNLFLDKDKKGGLLYSLNEKAKRMLESDKKFFKDIRNKSGIEACEEIEKYMKRLGKNEALIRIGKGAGFNSTSLNLFNGNVKSVATRTVVDDKPCGWAIVSFKEKN